ncbi:MAG: M24 family metallopeptidase [Candidatus Competibacterales bacterium]
MTDPKSALVALDAPRRRWTALVAELERRGLDGLLVPRADAHQNEEVAPSEQRLAWVTGFTGSAGLAVVHRRQSALFVDGRYTLQAKAQVDETLFALHHLIDHPPARWLGQQGDLGILGYDPWLHTPQELETLEGGVQKGGGQLRALTSNPVDAVWRDRPPAPETEVVVQPLEWAGEASADKRHRLAAELQGRGVDAAVLTDPAAIAWLLNVRAGDLPHTPVPLSFAFLHRDGRVDWFIDPPRVGVEVVAHLGEGVRLVSPPGLGEALEHFKDRTVQLDPSVAAAGFFQRLTEVGARLVREADPCLRPRAIKHDREIAGARRAQRADGLAMVRFLHWLEEATARRSDDAPAVDEAAVVERLGQLRAAAGAVGPSFDTIAGFGPNGAIVHYRTGPATNLSLTPPGLLLVDSGGQYPFGTTDVTRTIAIGQPSKEQRQRFTQVLRGHIALATVRFPPGTTGSQLDAIARLALWREGVDYDHGTGHGVGSFSGVHEGPQRIAKTPNRVALAPNMILSNEPGYYREGHYGIRLENLIRVTEAEELPGGDRPMLGFETLTLVPIDLRLVDAMALDRHELDWLNAYHRQVYDALAQDLDDGARRWLRWATRHL